MREKNSQNDKLNSGRREKYATTRRYSASSKLACSTLVTKFWGKYSHKEKSYIDLRNIKQDLFIIQIEYKAESLIYC